MRGGGGGGGQSHVADVGKQYLALSWHRGRQRTTPEISGAQATHRPGQKVDTHTHISIHTHTRTHMQAEIHRLLTDK